MSDASVRDELITRLVDLDEEVVLKLVQQRLAAGVEPLQIVEDCHEGMRQVGLRYEQGEYFVAGLIMSGEIFREVIELVQPLLVSQAAGQSAGRVLMGTVQGDIHDIGKNMTTMLLECYGFTVIDLGVDVSPAEFAAKAIEVKPDMVGLSGLITASFESMKNTVSVLRAEAQKHQLSFPIVIGGGMIDEQVCVFAGADYWVSDAMSGVRLCQRLMAQRSEG
ncbi:MAG TPA: cobalamin-dependent protein [Anaerolineae bacterium]|nr:cobalamin-dependent protein [Anaerolineae bacterium]